MCHINLITKCSIAIAIGIAGSLITACNKDTNPCKIPKEGENYVLSDSAKTYIHYYADANKIVFKTTAGAEVAFEVATQEALSTYEVVLPCKVDTFQNQTIKGTSQLMSASLSNSAILAAPIFISLVEYPNIRNRDAYETLVVSLGELFSNASGSGEAFYYYISGNNPQIHFLDSLTVSGKTFYSVYEMNHGGIVPNLEIKYTMNQGVIYIKDTKNSLEYVYDRKE